MRYKIHRIDEVAKIVIDKSKSKILLFDAPMGAGKTALIKHILQNISDDTFVGSPTFSLVHEYTSKKGRPVYHFDLYRLENIEQLLDIGFEEYLQSGEYIFIEWPELALPLLDDFTYIEMKILDETTREIIIKNK